MLDKSKPILIVDDIQPARETLINILRVLGYKEFLEASNGEEAKEILEGRGDIQLVISDWKMPRMDGFQLLRWMRTNKRFVNLPVLMVTSKGEKGDIALAADEDVTEYLLKPITVEGIISKLKNIEKGESTQVRLSKLIEQIGDLIKKDKFQEADKRLKQFIRKYPKTRARALYEMAKICLEKGEIDRAGSLVDIGLGENPLFPKGWLLKGKISIEKKDYDSALFAFKKAYEINPNSSLILFNMGNAHLLKGELTKARDFFLMALKVDPKNEQLVQDIWNAYLEKGYVDEVLREFKHILFEYLTVETLNNLAVSLRKKGNLDDAIIAYSQALKKEPENEKIHYNIAIAYLSIHNKKKATIHLKKAIHINPDFREADNLLKKIEKKEQEKVSSLQGEDS